MKIKFLNDKGIALSSTGDIMIEENLFEVLVQKALGVKKNTSDYAFVVGYGEFELHDSSFYCDYASDNGFMNLGGWIDENFVFFISDDDFNHELKKNNEKLHNEINKEINS